MKKVLKIIRFISSHPLTKDKKSAAFFRFARWQFISKLFPYPFIYPFVENTRLIVKKGMTGATGNVYVGLLDFSDMAFLLHFLRDTDLFGDIGANIGAYTILASGVVKAKSVAAEPVPATFKDLEYNIKINDIESLVSCVNSGLGEVEGNLKFTKNLDTVNHVVTEDDTSAIETIEIPVVTLDELFVNNCPVLLKIDVEGFELSVLKGGVNILANNKMRAIIIEFNGSGRRYGISDEEVHNVLLSYGFLPYLYNPFKRQLTSILKFSAEGNTIYIKDKIFAEERIFGARRFSAAGKTF